MRTFVTKKKDIQKKWYLINAENKILGRVACQIAHILKGKHKPIFTPHLDCGDNVVVINAAKVKLSKDKIFKKEFTYYTGYQSGQRKIKYNKLMQDKPEFAITHAVKGMLAKNRLGRKQMKNLRVFAGDHDLKSLKFVEEL